MSSRSDYGYRLSSRWERALLGIREEFDISNNGKFLAVAGNQHYDRHVDKPDCPTAPPLQRQLSSNAKRPIGRFDGALCSPLRTSAEPERSFGSVDNHLSLSFVRIIDKLVEPH